MIWRMCSRPDGPSSLLASTSSTYLLATQTLESSFRWCEFKSNVTATRSDLLLVSCAVAVRKTKEPGNRANTFAPSATCGRSTPDLAIGIMNVAFAVCAPLVISDCLIRYCFVIDGGLRLDFVISCSEYTVP